MAWTPVGKPSIVVWSNTNPMGKEQYDQSDIAYDSSTTYYDGTIPNQWTEVAKPSVIGWTNVPKPTP